MDAEVRRLDSMGQKSIVMKTMKLFVEHDTEADSYTNCVEVSAAQPTRTGEPRTRLTTDRCCQVEGDFDFDEITQILLSDSEPCPAKPGFSLVKVVTCCWVPHFPKPSLTRRCSSGGIHRDDGASHSTSLPIRLVCEGQ